MIEASVRPIDLPIGHVWTIETQVRPINPPIGHVWTIEAQVRPINPHIGRIGIGQSVYADIWTKTAVRTETGIARNRLVMPRKQGRRRSTSAAFQGDDKSLDILMEASRRTGLPVDTDMNRSNQANTQSLPVTCLHWTQLQHRASESSWSNKSWARTLRETISCAPSQVQGLVPKLRDPD